MKKWASRKVQRDQLILFEEKLDSAIDSGSQVRQLDAILDQLDWRLLESTYHGSCGSTGDSPTTSCELPDLWAAQRDSRQPKA